MSQWRRLRRIFRFLGTVKLQIVITCLVFLAHTVAEVFAVRLLNPAINVISGLRGDPALASGGFWEWITASGGSGAVLRDALTGLILAKVALSLLSWARQVCIAWQGMSMVFHMRAAVYDQLQRVGFSFYDTYSSGTLINRAISDLNSVRNFINTAIHSSLDIVFVLIGYFAVFVFDGGWEIALAAMIPLPFWIWTLRHFAVKFQPLYQRQMEASDAVVRLLTENVAGVHVVRAFAMEKHEQERFKAATETLTSRLLDGVRLRMRMNPSVRGIAMGSHVALFAMAAIMVQKGSLQIGAMVSFGVAMNIILGRIQQINAISDSYQQAVVSSTRLFEILDTPCSTPEAPDAGPLLPGAGSVRFTNVSFSYQSGHPVLQDVSFHIPAGSTVALVGPTGSGKTTLMTLLGRFYDPPSGKIEIDGQDLRSVTLQSVRENVGYVFQETFLFSDTIARNIAYANLDASKEKIKEAARLARAEEFIKELPQRYNTVIGEYGASLSGGQRQRLAIARALLHNPRILVMDDALAAVDPETETQIRQALQCAMEGRTVFLITSRISTARYAQVILVIENGRIVQSGSHEQLMRQAGYYREVAASQFGGGVSGHEASHMDRMSALGRKSAQALRREAEDAR